MRADYSKQWITPASQDGVQLFLEQSGSPEAHEALLKTWLLPVCAVSPYMVRVVSQYPDGVERLLHDGVLAPAAASPDLQQLLEELEADWQERASAAGDRLDNQQREVLQQAVLRRFRHRHMFRIIWRDLTGASELLRTLADLSVLADACIKSAERWTHDVLVERYGEPSGRQGRPQRLIVLGMGKLGGHELNVSSDIDLICLFAEAGQTTRDARGKGVIDNGEFFRRVVHGLTRLLNSPTEDGFVYRVDTRLRPFGDSGPLVMNLEGLENYYLTQARDWERYAMIKARAITGQDEDIHELQALVTPFVYRRYLDYNAFESLRDLKRKIATSVRRKGLVDNIKLGAGGIREIEFIGQAFQLVRGGRDERLRSRSIVSVLQQLARQKLLPAEEVDALLAAYHYLRKVENAVQMMRDEQVHSLPVDGVDQDRLITMLDEPDWPSFRERLSGHQQHVMDCFTDLFEVDTSDGLPVATLSSGDAQGAAAEQAGLLPITQLQDAWRLQYAPDADEEERSRVLQQCGFRPDEALNSAIAGLLRGGFYQRLTADSQERVERIVPLIMQRALQTRDPSETLIRCLALVRAVAGRSGYLQVLFDQSAALSRLVVLFAESRWLAGFVVRQPMVIDELLGGPGAIIFSDQQAVREDAREQLLRLGDAELDVQMDSLRHYRQGREMRIACAQLDGTLTLMQVSDQLTWLAEALIEVVLDIVRQPLEKRHGKPCCSRDVRESSTASRPSHVGIVAYGKLGGWELGFGSDLDLVFLHDSCGETQQTDGDKPVDNAVFYGKLAQKFVHFMGTTTPAGILYEIDLRLRPNGNSGVLVTGIESFSNYQRGDAWTWEHQALMRARMIVGTPELRERFRHTRAQVLAQPRPVAALREAVAGMRERMRVSLGANRTDSMHLKQDDGGVADIEFIVQYLVLQHAAEHPALLEHTDNIRVLDAIEAEDLLPGADVQLLRESYLNLRERLHRQALQEASSIVPLDDALVQLRKAVIELRLRVLGPAPGPDVQSGRS